MPMGSLTCNSISWKSWMPQEYTCISSKAAEIWECSDSSLEILSPADVLLSWLEPSVRSQLPSSWPAPQTSSAYVHLKYMPVCSAKLGQHFGWLLGSWLKSHHFLFVLLLPWQSFRQMLYFYLTCVHMVLFHVCVLRNRFLLYLALPSKAAAHSFS